MVLTGERLYAVEKRWRNEKNPFYWFGLIHPYGITSPRGIANPFTKETITTASFIAPMHIDFCSSYLECSVSVTSTWTWRSRSKWGASEPPFVCREVECMMPRNKSGPAHCPFPLFTALSIWLADMHSCSRFYIKIRGHANEWPRAPRFESANFLRLKIVKQQKSRRTYQNGDGLLAHAFKFEWNARSISFNGIIFFLFNFHSCFCCLHTNVHNK